LFSLDRLDQTLSAALRNCSIESRIDASIGTLGLAENRQHSRNCRDRSNQCQRNTNGFSLIRIESIGQEKCDPGAEHGPGDDDEAEFRPSKLDFFHKSKISGYEV
jgi:hypothetical protein